VGRTDRPPKWIKPQLTRLVEETPAGAGWVRLEGAISKQADRPYAPGDRGIWLKSKCLNREEFVVVGWTDPEGSRSHIGALLLGYYTDDIALRRPCRHRHDREGAETPGRSAGAASRTEDAARRAAAAQ
jgi:ATP-dependent DNA ligase